MRISGYRYLLIWAGLSSLAAFPGCRRPEPPVVVASARQPELKPAPPTPIAEKREELGGPTWNPEWDGIVEKALPHELLVSERVERDVRPYCPRYGVISEGDKRAFWAYFFQALAGAEAGLNPDTTVRHTEPEVAVKDDVTKRTVRQEGLLQLTYMDSERYGCAFNWEADRKLPTKDPAKTILQPRNNLECGVKILDNQLDVLHRPLLSSKSYWSTLQPGTVSFRVFAKQMANVPAVCKVDPNLEQAKASHQKPKAGRSVEMAARTTGGR
jgi:hypothetical protein